MWDEDDYYEQLLKRTGQEERDRKRWAEETGTSGLLKELTENGDTKEKRISYVTPKDKPVDYVLTEKLYSLRRNVEHIRKEIRTRWQIKERFQKEMDYQIDQSAFSLKNLQKGLGYNTGVDMKRNTLEMELLRLRSERRSHALRTWKDIIGLRKELREAMKEYEMLRRMRSVVKKDNGD